MSSCCNNNTSMPAGAPGQPGQTGDPGADGKTLLNGIVPPTAGDGVDGDFFIDTVTNTIYGPKSAGVWPAGVSLTGPQGTPGVNGTNATKLLETQITPGLVATGPVNMPISNPYTYNGGDLTTIGDYIDVDISFSRNALTTREVVTLWIGAIPVVLFAQLGVGSPSGGFLVNVMRVRIMKASATTIYITQFTENGINGYQSALYAIDPSINHTILVNANVPTGAGSITLRSLNITLTKF